MANKGRLPWHCKEELKHFYDTISNHPTVMGYKTFLSLPQRYFKDRMAIVFTRQKRVSDQGENLLFVSSLDEIVSFFEKELYVIGGAEIYDLFLRENLISEFILTKFIDFYEGDILFPLSMLDGWTCSPIRETSVFTIYSLKNPELRYNPF